MDDKTSANMYCFSFCTPFDSFVSSSVLSVSGFSAPLLLGGDVTSSFSDFGTSFLLPKDFNLSIKEDSFAGSGGPGVSLGTIGVRNPSSPLVNVVLEK